MNVKPYDGRSAEDLFAAGYRQTSRRHLIVSRVDVTLKEMDAVLGESGVPSCTLERRMDFYRSMHSKDKMHVPDEVLTRMRRLQETEFYGEPLR